MNSIGKIWEIMLSQEFTSSVTQTDRLYIHTHVVGTRGVNQSHVSYFLPERSGEEYFTHTLAYFHVQCTPLTNAASYFPRINKYYNLVELI